jgi:hypothetical protein
MSRILRRPMFRGGRVESKGDLKVVDQMGIAKLATGGRVGMYEGGDLMEKYNETLESIPMPERAERRGMSTGDYLRIASAGADILAAPSEGSGIFGALRSAAPSLSKLGTDLGGSIDARDLKEQEAYQKLLDERSDLAKTLTGAGIEYDIAELKSKGQLEVKKEYLDQVYEAKKKSAGDDSVKLAQIEKDYQKDYELFIVKGFDLSDLARIGSQDEIQSKAFRAAKNELAGTINSNTGKKWQPEDEGYQILLIQKAGGYVSIFTESITSTYAEGGTVTDVNVAEATPTGMVDVNAQQVQTEGNPATGEEPMQITYEELRARLPKEITDDIVNLLANSYAALADFAEIQTQADIDTFNVRYGVELVLPQES